MNLFEIISQVRDFLEQNGRVSYRMLRRQFGDDLERQPAEIREQLHLVSGWEVHSFEAAVRRAS